MKKKTNLTQYTKADLIWIINYMSRFGNDMYLQRAISELKLKKDQDRINEADKYAAIANEKRLAYINLLTPYDGKPWNEIPHHIVSQTSKLMEEAQMADQKYMQLMNIKE